MSAYLDKQRGTWFASFNCRFSNSDLRRITKRGFKTQEEALEYERLYREANHVKPTAENNKAMSFKSYVRNFYMPEMLEAFKGSQKAKNAKINVIENHIFPYFGDMQINKISAEAIEDWRDNYLTGKSGERKELNKSTIENCVVVLKAIVTASVRKFDFDSNPFDNITKPEKDRADTPKDSFKDEKYTSLLKYTELCKAIKGDEKFFVVCEMFFWTGMKMNELLALDENDFDFQTGTVAVNKTYNQANGKETISPIKRSCGERTVTLPEFLVKELVDYKTKYYREGERFFNVTPYFINSRLMEYSAGSQKRITAGNLRLGHIKLLTTLGFSIFDIGARIGLAPTELVKINSIFDIKERTVADTLNTINEN